ncbi:MAG TPA: hypothetical protein PLG15_06950 [Candidatus Gastranaerophilaceae bacterium]|mgnify:CR=1 FL=1|nr:hypothetical protein [Candidatus Gastranaerophilaceae bacterium]HPT42104.1 hypothetical protein [Candidatus Gastranaerophilaceae bacterium]
MSTVEYPAMIYKNSRNNNFNANCIVKNVIGFGKTEEEALNNLKASLQKDTNIEIIIKPMYGLSIAQ